MLIHRGDIQARWLAARTLVKFGPRTLGMAFDLGFLRKSTPKKTFQSHMGVNPKMVGFPKNHGVFLPFKETPICIFGWNIFERIFAEVIDEMTKTTLFQNKVSDFTCTLED